MNLSLIEKFQTLQALDHNVCIKLSSTGMWYVEGAWSIRKGNTIEGYNGFAPCMADAVEIVFSELTKKDTIVVLSVAGVRREVTWAGFMWRDV